MTETELDGLSPPPETGRFESGKMFAYQELRTRQLFKLLRIWTHGAAPMLSGMNLSTDDDAQTWGAKLMLLTVMALPEAESEGIEFIQSMVAPIGLTEGVRVSKADAAANEARWAELDSDLTNPTLGDTLTVIEGVFKRESPNLYALGKRVAAMLRMARQTGQLPTAIVKLMDFSEGSPAPSTSSPPNTDGPTMSSSTSPSADSVSASRSSQNVERLVPAPGIGI